MQNIPTQKLNNFRDLGGLKTQDGRTIRENCFLRTGTLHNLPEEQQPSCRNTASPIS